MVGSGLVVVESAADIYQQPSSLDVVRQADEELFELLSGVLAQGAERAHAQLDPLGLLRGLKDVTPADLTERVQRAIKSFMQGPDK